MAQAETDNRWVEPSPRGLRLVGGDRQTGDGVELPLLSASLHYWRLPQASWPRALEAVRELGFSIVDTYVPWNVHELAPGDFDFGGDNPSNDVVRFLQLVEEAGLHACVRPGPHCNAELTWFGIPKRVIWDEECQARGPRGGPVVLPILPLSFPVPSYGSEKFLTEATQWLAVVGELLAPLVWPNGPIVLCQLDNEGSFYFRDAAYDQDYHPDAISRYRAFLQRKHRSVLALRRAYDDPKVTFAQVKPPKELDARLVEDLPRHLDWAEFQESLIADALQRFRVALEEAGIDRVPFSHNFPPGDAMTALDPERVGQVTELLGLDYYHQARPAHRRVIAERTSELVCRAERDSTCPFAAEMGLGFPPFYPPLLDEDSLFTVMCAMAYGLRGFNAYMAVERDRWVGGLVSRDGKRRPAYEPWAGLIAAVRRLDLPSLRRLTPVRVVVPRSFRRLLRVQHAWGPFTPAAFDVMARRSVQAVGEEELNLEEPVAERTAELLAQLTTALEHRGVPYAITAGDLLEDALTRARWVVVMCPGALESSIQERLERDLVGGAHVSIGPHLPERDATWLPAAVPARKLELLDHDNVAALVEANQRRFELPVLRAVPEAVSLTLLSDPATNQPRVLFLLNPEGVHHRAVVNTQRLGGRQLQYAEDALTRERHVPSEHGGGELTVGVPPRSVVMLELELRRSS